MPEYIVSWTIEIAADSPEIAARQAQEIQRDRSPFAQVFDVTDEHGSTVHVDLARWPVTED